MKKNEWLSLRERAVHKDLMAITKGFNFYCKVKDLNPTPREVRAVQNMISINALITWIDVQLKVTVITKEGVIVKVF